MKSITSLRDRQPPHAAFPPVRVRALAQLSSQPMGPDCEDECPYCHGPETD